MLDNKKVTISDADVEKLKDTFSTKMDLKNLRNDTNEGSAWVFKEFTNLRQEISAEFTKIRSEMATKADLKKLAKKMAAKADLKDLAKTSDLADIMFELKAIREENAANAYRTSVNSSLLSKHDTRITKLEKSAAIS